MLARIIAFSVRHKFIVLLFTAFIAGAGVYALLHIPIGAVPDVTNNQVQVITTSRNLSTLDMEQLITYPVEMEMANLPGVQEIRSVSKFGISVVTIVFEDRMGTYLPRQLIAEKLDAAAERIPEGFGRPEMAPISTGLGEIFQYVLDVRPGYEGRYSPMDMRTIQDWVVKRQLAGIPGVVEINTWGGYLKQYEVALDNDRLQSMDVTAAEVFRALERNNSVAGGGYIEKVDQAYFIRGDGLVKSLEDIRQTVVENREGTPVLVGDVAEVRLGSAPRFGAITGNGQGEKVLGQVMMLKGANSKEVIDAVRQRVREISPTLPEGVYINAFLDRSELIGRTTFTVTENLVFGCLIVIFVVVLLLGNLRSGLIIASVIPLSLLFALSLMYVFGIDANLMSLGAIDFGIIIDGAVIIVEYTAFRLSQLPVMQPGGDRGGLREVRDRVTISSATHLMKSAVFGQLIILMVFIPILSLTGVEGKMFIPMALSFSFALLGAMLLCFTYVPVVSSLWLRPGPSKNRGISARILALFEGLLTPLLQLALRAKILVLMTAVALLVSAILLYQRIGAEFVPTLDEGDFVIQPVLKTGTSLSKTIDITTRIERILLDSFPEVDQVVTRIGAAEVPTDPMSMEESDVIIRLAPRSEWVSADSKEGLARRMEEVLAVFPGMEVEFTQPIEMRFNELITGVRADVAIKVFGDDLSVLADLGERIKKIVEPIPGAEDVVVEKVEGLPQMYVEYKRDLIARYGLSIADLNELITMGFSGQKAGDVFEGQRRFDLVLRLQEQDRADLDGIRELYVDLPGGGKIPLMELARIDYGEGAAKIARDNTRRRIVVSLNVRDRDLQSLVDEIEAALDAQLRLPVGYTVSYGGQFENLESARKRLAVAVPSSLLLVLIMLYFAFGSVREALLIFSAIPLSAVGGVYLLWVRGMPFSISAGVGFIALFGIAVLNGIVLVEHFKSMNRADYGSWDELIIQGTRERIRAVLLTASAAALGFLPMAVSTNAGAEVQRPLATVVIGGLITSTLLTLVVVPVLFSMYRNWQQRKAIRLGMAPYLILLLWPAIPLSAQQSRPLPDRPLELEDLITAALERHPENRAAVWGVNRANAGRASAWSLDKTQVYFGYDQNNLAANGVPLRVWGVNQSLEFPSRYFARAGIERSRYELARWRLEWSGQAIRQSVTTAYYDYLIAAERRDKIRRLDSLYSRFENAARRRFELGETTYLEQITARSQRRKVTLQLREAETGVRQAYRELKYWLQTTDSVAIRTIPSLKHPVPAQPSGLHPIVAYYQTQAELRDREWGYARQGWLPDLHLTYFQGSNPNLGADLFGYQLGISIPLLLTGHASEARQAKWSFEIAREAALDEETRLARQYDLGAAELQQRQLALDYYETEGLVLAREILRAAEESYRQGEIDFFRYTLTLQNGYDLQLEYLAELQAFNRLAIELTYRIPNR